MKIENIEELVNFITLVEQAKNSKYKFYHYTGNYMKSYLYKAFEDSWIGKESLKNYCSHIVNNKMIMFDTIKLELDDAYCIKEITIKDLFIYDSFKKSFSEKKTLHLIPEQTFKNILDSDIKSETRNLNTIKSRIEELEELKKKGPSKLDWVEKVKKENVL